jgi:hypothetical protein
MGMHSINNYLMAQRAWLYLSGNGGAESIGQRLKISVMFQALELGLCLRA